MICKIKYVCKIHKIMDSINFVYKQSNKFDCDVMVTIINYYVYNNMNNIWCV